MRIALLIIIALLLSGCCHKDPVEDESYSLTDAERRIIPYDEKDSIPFIHSAGYEFPFVVTSVAHYTKNEYDFCEWNCCPSHYYTYEVHSAMLLSDYPELFITLTTSAQTKHYETAYIAIGVNNKYRVDFAIDSLGQLVVDEYTQFYDTLSVNEHTYYNVYEKPFNLYYSDTDSTVNKPESILFGSAGIIQIKTTRDETYSINQ
jgi:hypothetical protein